MAKRVRLCTTCLNRHWIVCRVDTAGSDLWHCAVMTCPDCNRGEQNPPPYKDVQPTVVDTKQMELLRQ